MASLKVLRRRIRSVTSTRQITKAMEMVAAAKLRRAQARALATRPYAIRLTGMLENLAAVAREQELPLFAAREVKQTALVLIGSNRGLCGGFNTNLFRAAEERLRAAEPGSLALVIERMRRRRTLSEAMGQGLNRVLNFLAASWSRAWSGSERSLVVRMSCGTSGYSFSTNARNSCSKRRTASTGRSSR